MRLHACLRANAPPFLMGFAVLILHSVAKSSEGDPDGNPNQADAEAGGCTKRRCEDQGGVGSLMRRAEDPLEWNPPYICNVPIPYAAAVQGSNPRGNRRVMQLAKHAYRGGVCVTITSTTTGEERSDIP